MGVYAFLGLGLPPRLILEGLRKLANRLPVVTHRSPMDPHCKEHPLLFWTHLYKKHILNRRRVPCSRGLIGVYKLSQLKPVSTGSQILAGTGSLCSWGTIEYVGLNNFQYHLEVY